MEEKKIKQKKMQGAEQAAKKTKERQYKAWRVITSEERKRKQNTHKALGRAKSS